MEPKVTVEQQVEQLAAAVELLVARTRPGVREIMIDDEVKATQAKWAVDDIECLNPQYLDTLRAKKAKRYDEETSDVEKAIAPRFKPLRETIGQRFADARRLRSESERLDPSLHPERYVNARLLDEICRGNAEKFLKESEGNERAILEAYHAADDRRDVHLVKEIERRYGLTDEAPDECMSVDLPLRKAVRQRQDARISAGLRSALETLDRIEGDYKIARGLAFPSDANATTAVGAILRRAK